MKEDANALLTVLNGAAVWPPPVWLMRQAGRYLPEYRDLRSKAGSFWTLCMTPALAAEVTLQPIHRFGFDVAILFSDILVVPFAMGRQVSFGDGGPTLDSVGDASELDFDECRWAERLSPVYAAIGEVKKQLDGSTALLGFAGAPWTLATYLAEGHGSANQPMARIWGYRDPSGFRLLLDRIADCVAFHLIGQLDAGADAVQIFDSWAGGLPESCFEDWVILPTKRVVAAVRKARPEAKIVGFPRAATLLGYQRYASDTGVDAVSLDTAVSARWAMQSFKPPIALQGNLDPLALVAGGSALREGADEILEAMRGRPFIFNLGHGVLPETPTEHVAALLAQVRAAQ